MQDLLTDFTILRKYNELNSPLVEERRTKHKCFILQKVCILEEASVSSVVMEYV